MALLWPGSDAAGAHGAGVTLNTILASAALSLARCYRLGEAVEYAIGSWSRMRVVVLGTGGLSPARAATRAGFINRTSTSPSWKAGVQIPSELRYSIPELVEDRRAGR